MVGRAPRSGGRSEPMSNKRSFTRAALGGLVTLCLALFACKKSQSTGSPGTTAAPSATVAAPSSDPEDFSGVFALSGDRTGTMTVTRYRGAQYRITRSENGEHSGVGYRVGQVLYLVWSPKGAGLHIFTKSGAALSGSVFGSQEMKLGTEHLVGNAADDFTGKFKLDAEYPPGEKYKGTLGISVKDGIYHAAYYTYDSDGNEYAYTGYGVKEGDAVAVGTHSGDTFEYGAYKASADRRTFTGRVLASDKVKHGTWNETLTFKALP
jgi:hypothetical protein